MSQVTLLCPAFHGFTLRCAADRVLNSTVLSQMVKRVVIDRQEKLSSNVQQFLCHQQPMRELILDVFA